MGVRMPLQQLSNVQLQAHIRRVAEHSGRVFFTEHARDRMLERGVNDKQVLECLRAGEVQRPPQRLASGELRVRMEHWGSARHLSVVVSLDNDDPDALVITVITPTR